MFLLSCKPQGTWYKQVNPRATWRENNIMRDPLKNNPQDHDYWASFSIFTIFQKSSLILGCFRSTVLVKSLQKAQRIADHKMGATLWHMSSMFYDLCFINSLRYSHTNFSWICRTIDFDQSVWWLGFWGCNRQNSWHSLVKTNLDQSECRILMT